MMTPSVPTGVPGGSLAGARPLDRRGREIGPGRYRRAAHQRRHQMGPQHDHGIGDERGERRGAAA